MKIYLVRHARVPSNLRNIAYNNQENEALTKEGEKQAKKLAKRLTQINLDKIFISESKRAYQTILPFLRIKSIPFERDWRLNDCKYGIFGGLTIEEAKKKYPDIFEKRRRDKWNISIPKGESFKDLAIRLDSFLNDLKKEVKKFNLENILLITHATNLKVFLIRYLGFSVEKADSIYFENTSISIFDFRGEKIKPIIINDFSHLNESNL